MQAPYYGAPYPPPPPPPPPKPPMSAGWIIALVIIVVSFLGLFVSAAVFGAHRYVARARAQGSAIGASVAPSAAAFTESYSMKNDLVVVHYPADFAAKSIDTGTVLVSRNLADGRDELVQVGAVPNPISDEVGEFARILLGAMAKNIEKAGDTWTETSRKNGRCFRNYPGLLVEGSFTAKKRIEEHVRVCFFIDSNRGYEIKTIVPAQHEAEELPLLQAIANGIDIK